jgi:hypothetical protein
VIEMEGKCKQESTNYLHMCMFRECREDVWKQIKPAGVQLLSTVGGVVSSFFVLFCFVLSEHAHIMKEISLIHNKFNLNLDAYYGSKRVEYIGMFLKFGLWSVQY